MNLVVVYTKYRGSNIWAEVIQPLEYRSIEDFYEDFMEKLKSCHSSFEIAGAEFDKDDFWSCCEDGDEWFPPEVLSLDAWFETFKPL